MKISALLGVQVRTQSGDELGRVHDVRARLTSSSLRVTGLVVGRYGVLERLGIGAPRTSARLRAHDVVPWSAVIRVDRRVVVVRDGTEPR